MNITSRIALGIVLGAVLVGGLATAQTVRAKHQAGASGHHRFGARIAQWLGLTDAQKAQIQPIRETARAEAKKIWQNDSLTREQRRTQLHDLKDRVRTQVWPLLTLEQQQKVTEARAKMKERLEKRISELDKKP